MWFVLGLAVLASFPPLYVNASCLILKKTRKYRLKQAVVFWSSPLAVRRVVQRVGAHSMLRGVVG